MNTTEIELEILKSKIENLEHQIKFLNTNWVEWTNSTKNMGQRIMIALEKNVSNTP